MKSVQTLRKERLQSDMVIADNYLRLCLVNMKQPTVKGLRKYVTGIETRSTAFFFWEPREKLEKQPTWSRSRCLVALNGALEKVISWGHSTIEDLCDEVADEAKEG